MGVLKQVPWEKVDIEVLMIELEHAGNVFPGSRRDVHLFLQKNGFDYVGSWFEDDFFVRKDLNTPDRYGIAVDLEDLGETKSPFYDIYDLKTEEIPNEEEWALRMKELMPGQNEPLCMRPSEGEVGEGEDWTEEVNVKVKSTDIGGVEMDELKGKYVKKMKTIKDL